MEDISKAFFLFSKAIKTVINLSIGEMIVLEKGPWSSRNYNYAGPGKGQLISKCLFGAIVSTKKPMKFFKEFLP